MAINLNHERYGAQFNAFVDFASTQRNPGWIACIEGQKPGLGLLGPDGQPRKIAAKDWDGCGQFLRGRDSRTINNDVRKLFLDTVLAVCGVSKIEELPPAVLAVMKAEDYGKGRPLTARRITAVTDAIKSVAEMEKAQPVEKAKYSEPFYLSGLSKDLKDRFMSFYSAKLDGFAENGGPSKKNFDNVLSTLFNRTKGIMRKTLLELLVCGKIEIPVMDGEMPEGQELKKLDSDVKEILQSFRQLNGYSENIYRIAINTVKSVEGTIAPGDIDLTGEDIDDLREAGSEVDLSTLLSAKGDAEAIGLQLGEFKEKVYAQFDSKFPEAQAKYPAAKLAIMKNVFMHSAIIQPQIKYAQFEGVVSELRKNYRELVEAPATRELFGLILPSIEMASNQEIAKDPHAG